MTLAAITLAITVATAPAVTDERTEDQIDAITWIAVGGGFIALACSSALGAAASTAAVAIGVAASGAVATAGPVVLAFALAPLVSGALITVATAAIGIGLVTWGRGELREALARSAQRPARRPTFERRGTEVDEEDDGAMWPREKRRVAE